MQTADPDATATDDRVSLNLKIFVIPFKFVIPEFVNLVNEVVPFNMFETLVKVAYVLLAVLLNKYEEREVVKAYEDKAEDNA